jgi:predicted alpha/beta-fold hydrolase
MNENNEDESFRDCQDDPDHRAPARRPSTPSVDESSESEDAYRQRVYGTLEKHELGTITNGDEKRPSQQRLLKRFSKRLSKEIRRRRTSIIEALPDTPAGWTVLVSAVSSLCLGYELNLQKSLTMPPIVYSQLSTPQMKNIYAHLTATPESILRRVIQPSLFVGTRSVVASTAAYLLGGPRKQNYITFREVVTMPQDGAVIALDWELPPSDHPDQIKTLARMGPLEKHIVLILHGINNDANFGYVRSLMRACTERGWATVGFNFRGCGGVPLATPRSYTGAYTGDIRGVIQILSGRLHPNCKLFLVGNSLGANLITKYLGEEGRGGTLPRCVAGGISLGNPLHLHSGNIAFPWGHILSLGARKTILEQFVTIRKMKSTHFQQRIKMALMASTIGKFDEALAPVFIRNNPFPPYDFEIGYENGEAYWTDGSSYRYVAHVSVPLLQLSSEDDFLTSTSSSKKLHYCLANPNVLVVNTRCGGHLGWQECPPDNKFGIGTSWADTASVDFIEAVLKGDAQSVVVGDESLELNRNRIRGSAEEQAKNLISRL